MIKPKNSTSLDFLRACAVLFVYIAHLLQTFHIETLPGNIIVNDFGQTGVLFFFVHTCLVLMYSLERLKVGTQSLFLSFYIRRVFRIYPLSIAIILLMLLVRVPEFPTSQFQWIGWKGLFSNLALIQNLTGASTYPRVLWSLPYELQMYLVLPVLFLLVHKFRSVWFPILLWLVDCIFVWLLLQFNFHTAGGLLEYSPCFLGGLIAYRVGLQHRPRWGFWGWPVAIAACVTIRVFAHVFYFHGLVRVSSWIACACLGLLIPQFADLGKGVLAWLSAKTAQYSYGIYLSHCSVFWLCFVFLHNANPVVRWSLCLILSVALPLILFHTVEEPMIKVGVKLAARALGRRPTARESALETADSTAPVP